MDTRPGSVEPPTVSVIIPLYNKGAHIERALMSVVSQTLPPHEIIVVDDGSTDGGAETVARFHSPHITLIRQQNQGPGAARNTGLSRARGQYVAFLDADDEWLPGFLEAGVYMLENPQADISVVFTGYYDQRNTQKALRPVQGPEGGIYQLGPDSDARLALEIIAFSWTCTTMMKTAVARNRGGFYDKDRCLLGEDEDFFVRLIFNERFAIIPEPYAIYHREASHLFGGGFDTLPPSLPYMTDPGHLIAACPAEKHRLLAEFLELKTLETLKPLALWGKSRELQELITRFCPRYDQFTDIVFKIRLCTALKPFLPIIRYLLKVKGRVLQMMDKQPICM